jgi:hypothetical protein
MERDHLDFIGPLPRTERGNEHILMMVDQFTKWVECIPLPSQSAEVIILGVYPGLLFTEDLNAPANCGKY